MSDLAVARMKASGKPYRQQIDALRDRAASSTSGGEGFLRGPERAAAGHTNRTKLHPELPTITSIRRTCCGIRRLICTSIFTAFPYRWRRLVFCPQPRVFFEFAIVTRYRFPDQYCGRVSAGLRGTIDNRRPRRLQYMMGGHGPAVGSNGDDHLRKYIDDLTGKVAEGKKAG